MRTIFFGPNNSRLIFLDDAMRRLIESYETLSWVYENGKLTSAEPLLWYLFDYCYRPLICSRYTSWETASCSTIVDKIDGFLNLNSIIVVKELRNTSIRYNLFELDLVSLYKELSLQIDVNENKGGHLFLCDDKIGLHYKDGSIKYLFPNTHQLQRLYEQMKKNIIAFDIEKERQEENENAFYHEDIKVGMYYNEYGLIIGYYPKIVYRYQVMKDNLWIS